MAVGCGPCVEGSRSDRDGRRPVWDGNSQIQGRKVQSPAGNQQREALSQPKSAEESPCLTRWNGEGCRRCPLMRRRRGPPRSSPPNARGRNVALGPAPAPVPTATDESCLSIGLASVHCGARRMTPGACGNLWGQQTAWRGLFRAGARA